MDQRATEALSDFYADSYARLVGVVAVAAGSRADAEECVQEAFVRLVGRWSVVARYENPEAWVRTVAFRLLSNRRRKERNGLRALWRLGRTEDCDIGATDVSRALAGLSLPHRQVVVLHYLIGLPVAEIAEVLRVAPGTVKSRLGRARQALLPLLGEDRHA